MKFLLLLCALALSPLSFAQQIPLEDFVRHGDYLDMKISPDGKHLVARARAEGVVGILFLEAETMKFVGGVRPHEGDQIHSADWINNERVIYRYAEKRARYDQPMPTGEIFATNIDGSKAELLYGWRAGTKHQGSRIAQRESSRATPYVISHLEGDDDHILIIEHPWTQRANKLYDSREKHPIISKLNIYTGRKRELETLPQKGANALATRDGEVNFIVWRGDDFEINSAYRKSGSEEWLDINAAFNTDLDLTPVAISDDSTKAYLSGPLGEKKVKTLYELDLASGELSPVFDELKTDVVWWTTDHNTNRPIIAYTQPGKTAYHYADSDNQQIKLHKMLVDAFGNQTVSITSHSEDGKTILVRVSSDINPGEYYIFDTETMNAKFLWANRSWLDPRQMHAMQPFTFTTSDDVNVSGYLTMPTVEEGDSKPPMVVMIHGGPHGPRDLWTFDSEAQLLASRGYAVVQVNFRGSGGYGEVFEEMGYQQWGGDMIRDINEAAKHIIAQGKVDGDRVCAYGGSYGGYAALMTVIREPEMYQCTIGYVGLYDLRYGFDESDILTREWGRSYLNKVLGTDMEVLTDFSPVEHADDIKAKVMLLHGEKDQRVPVENSIQMQEALTKAGNPAIYHNFSKAGHGVYDETERKALYSALLEFLDDNIGEE